MNQSQSPTSLDLTPSLSPKRRGKGTIGSPNARDRSRACRAHAADSIPHQSPAPPDFDTTASGRGVPSLVRCANERGVSPKVSTELLAYIGGIESPLYSGNVSCQRGSARYDRWHRPQAATGAPRRRCGSCPTDCPADDGCPKRSSRSSPVRLPESASCR